MLSNSPLMFWRKLVFVRLPLLVPADQMAFSHTTRHANSVRNTLVVIRCPGHQWPLLANWPVWAYGVIQVWELRMDMCTQWKRCELAEDMEDMEGVTMEDRLSLHQCTSSRGHRRSWTYLLIKFFLRRDEKHEIKQTVETLDRVTSRVTQQTISWTSRLISQAKSAERHHRDVHNTFQFDHCLRWPTNSGLC